MTEPSRRDFLAAAGALVSSSQIMPADMAQDAAVIGGEKMMPPALHQALSRFKRANYTDIPRTCKLELVRMAPMDSFKRCVDGSTYSYSGAARTLDTSLRAYARDGDVSSVLDFVNQGVEDACRYCRDVSQTWQQVNRQVMEGDFTPEDMERFLSQLIGELKEKPGQTTNTPLSHERWDAAEGLYAMQYSTLEVGGQNIPFSPDMEAKLYRALFTMVREAAVPNCLKGLERIMQEEGYGLAQISERVDGLRARLQEVVDRYERRFQVAPCRNAQPDPAAAYPESDEMRTLNRVEDHADWQSRTQKEAGYHRGYEVG